MNTLSLELIIVVIYYIAYTLPNTAANSYEKKNNETKQAK